MLNGDRHAAEIAYFAVHILKMLQRNTFSESMNGNKVQLQIGISTGNFIPLSPYHRHHNQLYSDG